MEFHEGYMTKSTGVKDVETVLCQNSNSTTQWGKVYNRSRNSKDVAESINCSLKGIEGWYIAESITYMYILYVSYTFTHTHKQKGISMCFSIVFT